MCCHVQHCWWLHKEPHSLALCVCFSLRSARNPHRPPSRPPLPGGPRKGAQNGPKRLNTPTNAKSRALRSRNRRNPGSSVLGPATFLGPGGGPPRYNRIKKSGPTTRHRFRHNTTPPRKTFCKQRQSRMKARETLSRGHQSIC